jgi:RNA polymerase sigma-70 factor, ECF subfamily
VQETLLRAWRHSANLTAETARPWLFRLACNLVVDGHRAARRRPREVSTDVRLEASERRQGPDDLDRALLAWPVADALRRWPGPERSAGLCTSCDCAQTADCQPGGENADQKDVPTTERHLP